MVGVFSRVAAMARADRNILKYIQKISLKDLQKKRTELEHI